MRCNIWRKYGWDLPLPLPTLFLGIVAVECVWEGELGLSAAATVLGASSVAGGDSSSVNALPFGYDIDL